MKSEQVQLEQLSDFLDSRFRVFGFSFGLDPLIGLIPGAGDVITFLIGLYVVFLAVKIEVPRSVWLKMILNLSIDLLLGAIPIIGDVSDFIYRANGKNVKLLKKYLSQKSEVEVEV